MGSDTIKRIAEIYAGHQGLKLSTLGAYVVNDGKFFTRIANGGDCRSRTVIRVLQWFADHWPSDLEWPRDIPRPAASLRRAA
jgi:hypothetical protein